MDGDAYETMASPALRSHLYERFHKRPMTHFSSTFELGTVEIDRTSTRLGWSPLGVGAHGVPLQQLPDGRMRMYFQIVRWAPSKVKRTKTAEDGDISGCMVAIAPRKVIREDLTREHPIVDASSIGLNDAAATQSILLGLSSLSFNQLLDLHAYEIHQSELMYGLLPNVESSLPLELTSIVKLPRLLRRLMEDHSHSGSLFDFEDDDSEYAPLLATLIQAGLGLCFVFF